MRRATYYFGWTLAVATFVGTTIAAGCTASDDSNVGDDDGSGNGGTGASAASGGGGTGNASASGGMDFDAGMNDGTLGDGDTCLAETAEATLTPLHMIIVIDRSGSMDYYGYWQPTKDALTAFLTDPLSDGLYVGLNFFPAPGHGNDCNQQWWNPVQVPPGAPPMALLPDDAATLTGAIASATSPMEARTPLWGGLEGSYNFIRQTMMPTYPEEKHVVVLISDGLPNECDVISIPAIASMLVGPAFDDDGIETYTLAIDASVTSAMDTIAAAGGTTSAYDVTGSHIDDFAQHMQDIRGRALGCEYIIPDQTGAEQEFDPLKVNVYITWSGETEPTLIPQVGSAAECGTDHGWYYDDPVNPTTILLCPATCERIEQDQEAKIEIAFGCPTEVK